MDNAQKHIFTLEGSAFSGKTTLLNYIAKNHGGDFCVVPETSEYVGGDKNLPDIPFADFEAAKANVHYFIALEKIRCRDALRLYEKYQKPVIMDRSTPISSPVFYALLEDKHPEFHNFKDSFFRYALECFAKEVKLGNIFIPSGLIYLAPADENTFISRLPRGTKNMVFARWESFVYLDEKYKILASKSYENHYLPLTSVNGEDSLKENAKRLSEFTAKPLPLDPDLGLSVLDNFIGKDYQLDTGIDVLTEEQKYKAAADRAIALVAEAENQGLISRNYE